MKKMLCMVLALVMALSLTVPAIAATTETKGNGDDLSTKVTYNASETPSVDTNGDGEINEEDIITEATWTVTVPESVTVGDPQDADKVSVSGFWMANTKIVVTVPAKTIYMADGNGNTVNATVTFADLEVVGNNTVKSEGSNPISVAWETSAPAFGTWTGYIEYSVSYTSALVDNGN